MTNRGIEIRSLRKSYLLPVGCFFACRAKKQPTKIGKYRCEKPIWATMSVLGMSKSHIRIVCMARKPAQDVQSDYSAGSNNNIVINSLSTCVAPAAFGALLLKEEVLI